MNFNSVFKLREQAEQMATYLKNKQGVESSIKEVMLILKDEELELHGELSPLERVNAKQILVTLLAMDRNNLIKFLDG